MTLVKLIFLYNSRRGNFVENGYNLSDLDVCDPRTSKMTILKFGMIEITLDSKYRLGRHII